MMDRSQYPVVMKSGPSGDHLLLYDGVCALCNGMVSFVLRHDSRRHFDLASLQSAAGREALRPFNITSGALDTFYVVTDYRSGSPAVLDRAPAVLFVARTLGWPWRGAGALRILPRAVLDTCYNIVAKFRYRVFGEYETCPLPRPEHRDRFIDQ